MRWFCVAALLISGCGGCDDDPASANDAASPMDASGTADATSRDAAAGDAGPMDSTIDVDSGVPDAGATDAGEIDAGMFPARGTCMTPADCDGLECVNIPDEPGGWHTCVGYPRIEVKFCNPGEFGCCDRGDCTGGQEGRCIHGPLWYCGGAPPLDENVCVYQECTTRADCTLQANGLCIPARAFDEASARCTYGDCVFDAECTSRAGGQCLPFFDPCVHRMFGFYCTYADSPCRADADCAATPMGYCGPGTDGQTSCMQFIPPP